MYVGKVLTRFHYLINNSPPVYKCLLQQSWSAASVRGQLPGAYAEEHKKQWQWWCYKKIYRDEEVQFWGYIRQNHDESFKKISETSKNKHKRMYLTSQGVYYRVQ